MKKFLSAMLASALLVTAMAGCGSATNTAPENAASTASAATATTAATAATASTASEASAAPTTAEKVSGTLTMSGSTSMETLCKYLIESYADINPNLTITAEYVGSGAGLSQCAEGTVEIGNSSRHLKDEETAQGLVENVVAIDGIAVVVNKACGVTSLTQDQLKQVFTGAITNWKDLGGSDSPIVVVGRESGSGTRDAFEELLDIADTCNYAQELNSTGAVKTTVATTTGAIGYISLDVLDDSVQAVSVDGVEPTEENIKAGTYVLNRPFVMATKGAISSASPAVQEFLNWVLSSDGQAVVKEAGLITVS